MAVHFLSRQFAINLEIGLDWF